MLLLSYSSCNTEGRPTHTDLYQLSAEILVHSGVTFGVASVAFTHLSVSWILEISSRVSCCSNCQFISLQNDHYLCRNQVPTAVESSDPPNSFLKNFSVPQKQPGQCKRVQNESCGSRIEKFQIC